MSEDIIDRDQLLHAFCELGLTNVNDEVNGEEDTNILMLHCFISSFCLKSMKG